MVCIYCSEKTKTVNSRPTKGNSETWRRKECPSCGAIFTTREQIDLASSFRVKSDGKLLTFSRDTLFISIYKSLSHRETAASDASNLVDTTLIALRKLANRGVLGKETIRKTTLATLERFDTPAGVYYQAHYC